LTAFFSAIIQQDLDVFAALQAYLEARPDLSEVLIPSDKPGALARRIIERQVALKEP